ncbi:MAG: diguanylate cyclase [Tissierellia bacterium]|nr:diguanylate cyclase [Tissierellia bacterium]
MNKEHFLDEDKTKLDLNGNLDTIIKVAIEQTAVSIVITDVYGNIQYVNPAFENTTGYTFEEVKGKNPRILKSGLTPDEVFEELWETITSERPWEGELINKRKDESIYYEEARISPIIDTDGKITNFLGIKQDITTRKYLEEKLKQTSIRDPLTNIYNRGYVFERLYQNIELYKRERSNFSLAILDLDHFKKINDTYGHQVGDFVLKEFAEMLACKIRAYDTMGRYGGEEFVILFHNSDRVTALKTLERIAENLNDYSFKYGKEDINITFSCGIADAMELADDELSVGSIIELADKRLYEAKEMGRNNIVID